MSSPLSNAQFGDGDYAVSDSPKETARAMAIAGGFDNAAVGDGRPGYKDAFGGHYTPSPKQWVGHAKVLGYGNIN